MTRADSGIGTVSSKVNKMHTKKRLVTGATFLLVVQLTFMIMCRIDSMFFSTKTTSSAIHIKSSKYVHYPQPVFISVISIDRARR